VSGPLNFDDSQWPDCYKPVIDGLRHLTRVPSEPTAGEAVALIDGDTFTVGSRRPTPAVYDCHVCAEEWAAHAWSLPPVVPQPRPQVAPGRDGRASTPVGAGDPDYPAPTGLPQETPCR
jgi:hypothetical protein